MATADRSGSTKPKGGEPLARRVGALVEGLTVARVLRADERELVLEMTDGTRLLVRAGGGLEISVT